MSVRCASQPYFSKMFDVFHFWETAWYLISYDSMNHSLTYLGTSVNLNSGVTDTTKYHHIYISKVDSSLQTFLKLDIGKGGIDYGKGNLIQTPYSEIIPLGLSDTSNNFISQLLYITKTGDTTKSYAIQNSDKNFIPTFYYYLNPNKIVIFGIEAPFNSQSPLSILCIDTLGKKKWSKIFSGKRCYTNNVVQDSIGNLIIAGQLYRGDGIDDTAFCWYAKMDTACNFIWEKVLDQYSNYYCDVCWTFKANSNIFLGGGNDGSYFASPVQNVSFAYMMSVDGNGNIYNYKRYFTSPYLKKLLSFGGLTYYQNSLYGIGEYATDEGWTNNTQYLMFVKLDLQGNLQWKRLFKQWYRDNRPWSLTPVSDGFIICADGKDTTHTTGYADAWIIKTDTNGCVVPGCNLHDGMVQIINPEAFVRVYPNPANDVLNIEITDERAKAKNFFMYDNIGNLVTHKNVNAESNNYVFPTSNIKTGLYYFVIELQDGSQATRKILIQK